MHSIKWLTASALALLAFVAGAQVPPPAQSSPAPAPSDEANAEATTPA